MDINNINNLVKHLAEDVSNWIIGISDQIYNVHPSFNFSTQGCLLMNSLVFSYDSHLGCTAVASVSRGISRCWGIFWPSSINRSKSGCGELPRNSPSFEGMSLACHRKVAAQRSGGKTI